MFRSDLRKKRVCSKSATEMFYGNKFLVSECIFKVVCHCENRRLSEIGCETSLNRLLLFLILKSSYRSYSVGKGVLKIFFRKAFLLEPLFNEVAGLRACNTGAFQWNLQNFLGHLFLKTTVSPYRSLFTVHEKETVNYFLKKVTS